MAWSKRDVKVVDVVARGRGRPGTSSSPTGTEALALLEELTIECFALAGLDATAPMRRDVVRVVRRPRGARRRT
jgi:hypothetical protein